MSACLALSFTMALLVQEQHKVTFPRIFLCGNFVIQIFYETEILLQIWSTHMGWDGLQQSILDHFGPAVLEPHTQTGMEASHF